MNDNEIITSRDNAKLKLARAVRDGRERGMIFVEGVRLAEELFGSGLDARHVLVSSAFAETEKFAQLSELLLSKRASLAKVATNLFRSMTDTENSQGIVVLAERPAGDLGAIIANREKAAPTVLLHKINNPANLGAVVRTAEAAGAAGVVTTAGSADAFSPKAVRASMGSCFRLPVVEGVEFRAAIDWAKADGLINTAADIGGSDSYFQVDWTKSRLLIFGSEAHGLSEGELQQLDESIKIPMDERVESLNLAVSAGIILFEAKRQRG